MRAAAGHPVNLSIQVDNIEASKAHGLAQGGLLADHPAEASVHHQAGLSVRLLGAGEVLSEALVVAVTLVASMAVVASEVLMEEVTGEAMEEAIGKPKEQRREQYIDSVSLI